MSRRTTLQTVAFFIIATTFCFAVERNNKKDSDSDRQNNNDVINGDSDRPWRLREGMKLVNLIGELKESGGRIAFEPDGEKISLQLLENLAMERVSQDLDQRDRKWSVSGLVTEYRGGNYLLLQRAVAKAHKSSSSGSRK